MNLQIKTQKDQNLSEKFNHIPEQKARIFTEYKNS